MGENIVLSKRELFFLHIGETFPFTIPIIAINIIEAGILARERFSELDTKFKGYSITGPYDLSAKGPLFIIDSFGEVFFDNILSDSKDILCVDCDNVESKIKVEDTLKINQNEIFL